MKIPLSRVYVDDSIKNRVLSVIDSQNFILGAECAAFEAELAAYAGVKHCVLSSSWTAATHLLLIALGVGEGDEIIVPAHTAFPSIEPIIHAGARPVFVDVDDFYTADAAAVRAAVTPRTVALMPVHLYGHPADLDQLAPLAEARGLVLLEDCAQAHGATWRGRRVGGLGHFGAFSFYPSKNLTVFGDGGCIVTNDGAVAEKLRMLRDHGRRKATKYLHELAGYNLRFNEIQAAVGREQLKHLDQFNADRRRVAAWYRQRLGQLPGVQLPAVDDRAGHVYHMFVIQIERRDALAAWLKERGVATGIHYPIPNHRQPAVTELYRDLPALPRTEALVDRILSLPMFPAISEAEVDYVCAAIGEFLNVKK
ncbi:MAG: DegT/DnrJ/EryC1/StrS family aminotransferase [Verrucomicrobiales bacterium]|jgi:dTDP-4-amino-4,6-dideoxygalactose transaminase|nr:DegT/DnrJ/EryC1/StrS family aminotransferase [Verrucomicrobiales bacterium]